MAGFIETTGIVLKSVPVKEYDRRVVILTGDFGKISAFANGARRQGNRFAAATDLFVLSDFKLYGGRESYSISDINPKEYFEVLRRDMDAALLGMYFLEYMDHCTAENNDEREMLILLYQSLRALTHPAYDRRLVRAVFELKSVMLLGVFNRDIYEEKNSPVLGTADYIAGTETRHVFSFALKEEALKELEKMAADAVRRAFEGHEFSSLALIKTL
ncbi:MAG: DNA repair protein RecO [Lachnospiraceae bacterium]|nr:DNA repair protein RecO [Lachnospiraceae bacterium]MCR4936816.1 DNA repair protein RecO [Lachnospiraceae bacterium]